MSKLKLKALELGARDSPGREALKNITGGTGPDGPWLCVCPDGEAKGDVIDYLPSDMTKGNTEYDAGGPAPHWAGL